MIILFAIFYVPYQRITLNIYIQFKLVIITNNCREQSANNKLTELLSLFLTGLRLELFDAHETKEKKNYEEIMIDHRMSQITILVAVWLWLALIWNDLQAADRVAVHHSDCITISVLFLSLFYTCLELIFFSTLCTDTDHGLDLNIDLHSRVPLIIFLMTIALVQSYHDMNTSSRCIKIDQKHPIALNPLRFLIGWC